MGQDKPPRYHSYIKPKIRANKKKNTDQKQTTSVKPPEITQGSKKIISKSNTINKIATTMKWLSKTSFEDTNGSKPHSQAESRSTKKAFGASKKGKQKITNVKTETTKK